MSVNILGTSYDIEATNNNSVDDDYEFILLKINNINLDDKNNNIGIKINNKDELSLTNSNTAKNGFKEEENMIKDLNNNEELHIAFETFINKKITKTFAKYADNHSKIDINNIDNICIQVKKYKKGQFGQVDRHWIDEIINKIPLMKNIEKYLKNLCEYPLKECGKIIDKSKSIKKLNNTNYTNDELNTFLKNINERKKEILKFAFCGYSEACPQYLCGVEYDKNNKRNKIIIYNIIDVLTYLEQFDFKIKKSETVIELGDCFTLQRKGGDGGKKSSNQLQFKLIFSKLNIVDKLEYMV